MENGKIDNFVTINQARDELKKELEKGTFCPVCDKFAKKYKRKIHSAMAHALIILYNYDRFNKGKFVNATHHVAKLQLVLGDISKLKFWDLIERQEGEREDGNPSNGYYRITAKGKDFVNNRIKIPKYAWFWNNEVESWSELKTDIKECLGDKFDYDELMKDILIE